MKLAFVDHGLPIQETLGVLDDGAPEAVETPGAAKRRLRRGVVNVVDVDIPLGMIIPRAKLALVSVSDTQGASSAAMRPSRRVDITEITFPYQPGDYVVHAAHGVAHFKSSCAATSTGTSRDYLLLEYAEGDKLYVPVEQLDRVDALRGAGGREPAPHAPQHGRLVARAREGAQGHEEARVRPRGRVRRGAPRRRATASAPTLRPSARWRRRSPTRRRPTSWRPSPT